MAAYLAVADSLADPKNHGRAWNAGHGRPVTVLGIMRALIAGSGVDTEPETRGEGTLEGEAPGYWLDAPAIQRELGWSAEWDLPRALEATYDWYARHVEATGRSVPSRR